jgi:hypothetical protein
MEKYSEIEIRAHHTDSLRKYCVYNADEFICDLKKNWYDSRNSNFRLRDGPRENWCSALIRFVINRNQFKTRYSEQDFIFKQISLPVWVPRDDDDV